jgi:large subunit ribosomal protein L30
LSTKKRAKRKASRKVARPRTRRKHVIPKKPAEAKPEPQPPQVRKETPVEKSFILALRLKGSFGAPSSMERALETLHLKRRFNGALVENKPYVIGMLRKVKDYITWGELRTKDIAKLLKERGELTGGMTITDETVRQKFGEQSVEELATALTQGRVSLGSLRQKGLNPVFKLRPPSGGFVSTIKRPFGSRGELGHRGPSMSSLLMRMV